MLTCHAASRLMRWLWTCPRILCMILQHAGFWHCEATIQNSFCMQTSFAITIEPHVPSAPGRHGLGANLLLQSPLRSKCRQLPVADGSMHRRVHCIRPGEVKSACQRQMALSRALLVPCNNICPVRSCDRQCITASQVACDEQALKVWLPQGLCSQPINSRTLDKVVIWEIAWQLVEGLCQMDILGIHALGLQGEPFPWCKGSPAVCRPEEPGCMRTLRLICCCLSECCVMLAVSSGWVWLSSNVWFTIVCHACM